MGHLVRDESWGIVDVDLDAGAILVREDWRYEWRVAAGQPPWSPEEMVAYHQAVDRLVWATWSLKARIFPSRREGITPEGPAADLVGRFGGRGLQLSFDVRYTKAGNAHWAATVTKVDHALHPRPRSHVWFEQRRLELHSTDVILVEAKRSLSDSVRRPNFRVAPHEFGHTLRYGDDYKSRRHYDDVASIMNIGRRVRPRHLSLVVETLGKMVPGCKLMAVMQ